MSARPLGSVFSRKAATTGMPEVPQVLFKNYNLYPVFYLSPNSTRGATAALAQLTTLVA